MEHGDTKPDRDLPAPPPPYSLTSTGIAAPLAPPINVPLTILPPHDCPYLPDREATTRAFRTDRLPGELYHHFMDAGFRRSGKVIYQQVCQSCRLCVPIRVPVDRFTPSKSQRRSIRRNADLIVTAGPPVSTDEKFELYQRYQKQWHDKHADTEEDRRDSFNSFLYESPVQTIEFCYRTSNGQLAAVGIVDVCAASLSSVYFYFDPSLKHRSLGTFGAVYELEWAKIHGIPHYYLGFWISGCAKMAYKINFRPYQLLADDGSWMDAAEDRNCKM